MRWKWVFAIVVSLSMSGCATARINSEYDDALKDIQSKFDEMLVPDDSPLLVESWLAPSFLFQFGEDECGLKSKPGAPLPSNKQNRCWKKWGIRFNEALAKKYFMAVAADIKLGCKSRECRDPITFEGILKDSHNFNVGVAKYGAIYELDAWKKEALEIARIQDNIALARMGNSLQTLSNQLEAQDRGIASLPANVSEATPSGQYIGNLSVNPLASNSTSGPFAPMLNNPYASYELYDNQGQFRGNLNRNQFDPDSVFNPFGRYGSQYSPDSINNKYGAGSRFAPDSPINSLGDGMRIYQRR